jgi:hypothetical protein
MLKQKKIKIILILFVMIVAVIIVGFFYTKNRKLTQNSNVIAQKEVSDLVEKVSKLIVLPEGEVPTIATVSDLVALKDQPFFAQAQKGDKVLIYSKAKKAILYSVTLKKIVEVAPLTIDSQNQ